MSNYINYIVDELPEYKISVVLNKKMEKSFQYFIDYLIIKMQQ